MAWPLDSSSHACSQLRVVGQAQVVWKVDIAIYRISHYPDSMVKFVLLVLIHWIGIYPVATIIQAINS